jgi:cytidylate kinase
MAQNKIIAIDGYSSTGKSTVAKRLAKHLHFIYVDSGAMYRAVSLYALNEECFDNDKLNADKLVEKLDEIEIDFKFDNDTQKSEIFLNGKNVEDLIRGMHVSQRVSQVATIPEVRNKLVDLQRKMAEQHSIIMDGRDIGSVVFPKADVKFFMTASAHERAKRRFKELKSKGDDTSYKNILDNVKSRDHIDTTRKHSPLVKVDDAIEIDNSNLSQDEQFELMLKYIKKLGD